MSYEQEEDHILSYGFLQKIYLLHLFGNFSHFVDFMLHQSNILFYQQSKEITDSDPLNPAEYR